MPNAFRWDIKRREQLGRLVEGEAVEHFDAILEAVRQWSARVIAMAGDARLVFIGRSPENLYDYLTGALSNTSWASRPATLNVSLKGYRDELGSLDLERRRAIRGYFRALALDPRSIATSAQPVALIDVIDAGETFERILELLFSWAAEERIDERAVRRRLRIVGITESCNCGPKTWRWQSLPWAAPFRRTALKGVAVPWWFWSHLGNSDAKVSRTNPPERWTDPEMAQPPRGKLHAEALRLALGLYTAGRTRPERDAFAAAISEQRSMRHAWCRVLVAELRAASRPKRIERSFGSKQRARSWRRHVDRRKADT